MFAIRHSRRNRTRRGAILLVVLAMLALFAVIALSFVLYAESESTSLRNGRAARNAEADPNPQEAANQFIGVLIFDTDDNTAAINGSGLATAKYGRVPGQQYSPYSGNGLIAEDVSAWAGLAPGTLDRRVVVNYSRDIAGNFIRPNLRTDNVTPINKSTPYTYADRANFYLAIQNPVTGEIVQPSFHRPDLFGGLDPTNGGAASNNWTNPTGRYLIVRPRALEHPNFPLVPANADGTYTGDVQNMKFIAGTQKNDSLWMYTGAPVKTWRNKQYTAMIAPLVLDLSGRVNMSVAGNNSNNGAGGTTASSQGFGAWEVNPQQLGIDPTEFQKLVSLRYSGNTAANQKPPGNRYTGSTAGTINGGVVPSQYALIDSDGVGGPAIDPMRVPVAGEYNPFMIFSSRYTATQANFTSEQANHPHTFNPFHWTRGTQAATHAFGMDDLVKLTGRYSDPKNRYGSTEFGVQAPTSFSGSSAVAMQNRALTTAFNVTQTWGEVTILTNNTGGSAKLGPVDVNRKLPDYRTNTALGFDPTNVDMATPSVNVLAARAARQRLAMDIFLRLAALSGQVDGTVVLYNASANMLTTALDPVANAAQFNALQKLAQYAANIVDAIDNDDISTAFVWNPIAVASDLSDPATFLANTTAAGDLGKRVVYGTELPRLVINEAYCKLDNDRSESQDAGNSPTAVMGKKKATQTLNLQKKYWVELHNPLPTEPATSLLSELGGARLQYVNGTSPGATSTYAVYTVEVAETVGTQPLYNHLSTTPTNVIGDTTNATLVGANYQTKLLVNNYTYNAVATNPATPPATLAGDELNIVRPAVAGSSNGPNGSNSGYYVLGPADQHPSKTFNNSMSLPDPPAMAAAPQNAMWYDTGLPPKQANIDILAPRPAIATTPTSTVVLRRLANPYQQPQLNPAAANYNPYITVDYLENVPTRDRVEFNENDDRAVAMAGFTLDAGASIGRRHPYANMPAFDPANPDMNMVVQQTRPAADMVSPPHSFFSANYTSTNPNPGGMEAYIHYDRELINSIEMMSVSAWSPSLLTPKFSNGVAFNQHIGNGALPALSALLNPNFPAPGLGTQMFKAFELLSVANRLPSIPLGGREPGKVNINTAADSRILQAVLDAQGGNTFDSTYVGTAWANTVQPSRTPNWGTAPYIRATTDETGAAGDRPFKLNSGGLTVEDTLFRSTTGFPGYPMMFNGAPVTNPVNPAAANSLYLQAEPHRKAWNNLTTVSDGFLVIWTVGFFEVDQITAAGPQIGKELFDKVPGDFRAQYSAIVDRSMLQVPAVAIPGTNGTKPWETKLSSDVAVGSLQITVEGILNGANLRIYNDGVAVDVAPGAQLRLGTGDMFATLPGEGEWVTIGTTGTPIVAGAAGQVVITLDPTTPTQRFHGGSGRVSNSRPGNPGPQPNFDPSLPANRHLVPFFTRMDP